MRVGLVDSLGYNNTKKQNNFSFGTNKAVYLCSTLASGFVASEKCPTIKEYIALNAEKALDYAKKIVLNKDFAYWNHTTWPKFLDDTKPEQRATALKGCLDLVSRCEALVYFGEPKGGMVGEIDRAKKIGQVVLSEAEYDKMVADGTFDKFVEDSPHYKRLHAILDNEGIEHTSVLDLMVENINGVMPMLKKPFSANA